jgi:hypothetical protein
MGCPLCAAMEAMGALRQRHAPFFKHFRNAQLEMLRALQSLVEERIASLEERGSAEEAARRATKIEVE